MSASQTSLASESDRLANEGGRHPDAELRALIAETKTWPPLPPLSAATVGLHRVSTFREQAFDVPYEEVAEVRELVATGGPGPVRVKLYVPSGGERDKTPAVIRLHGGGMVMGSPENEDRTSRVLANRAGCRVLAPAYRLAPEHPFPAGPTDCQTAIRWVVGHTDELSIDAERIAVLGHSAGGLLALTSAMALRDAGVQVCRYVALEPTTGPDVPTASRRDFATGYLLTTEEISAYWRLYLGAAKEIPVGAAPANATAAELRGLDPISILTAEFDPLRDEAELFAEQLRAAHVDVEHRRLAGSIHGSLGFMGVSQVARSAFATVVDVLDRSWTRADEEARPTADAPETTRRA